ncbi:MAG TPA: YibE/F family protein [Negativicutes bacterium]
MSKNLWLGARILVLLVILVVFGHSVVFAASSDKDAKTAPAIEYVTGTVLEVQPLTSTKSKQGVERSEMISICLTSGPESGNTVHSINYTMNRPGFDINPKVGDKVIVAVSQGVSQTQYNIADYDRIPYMYILLGLFVVILLVVGGRVGLKSLFVVCFACFIILQGMIPLILTYHLNLIMITLLTSAIIAFVTQTTVSGWNPKTWGAVVGTVGGVAIAGILASLSIGLMHLTGLDNEEAIMLKVTYLAAVDFQEILFAGIVLGSLGAVMDVAISIASAQYEVKLACPHFGYKEIFKSGINVGRDVMGTMSNTLILAYLGSSLPLVLLLSAQNNVSLLRIMNLNLIVTEITRAITGSIGLLCCIPLTALVTAFFLSRRQFVPTTNTQCR